MIITRQLSEIPETRSLAVDFKAENTGDIIKTRRIGLALSGGGFRAAIFHLGVIRRLEELGIMSQIRAISSVSGGSIIAAYYLCEMERRLHLEPVALRENRDVRLRIFEEIAADFLAALDKNLRSRALFYTPFYHPWLFVKTLLMRPFRASARSILIQEEYDRWLALLVSPQFLYWLGDTLADFLFGLIPAAAVSPVDALFARFGLPELSVWVKGVSGIAAFAGLFAFLLYLDRKSVV